MLMILLSLIAGGIAGFLLRNRTQVLKTGEKLAAFSIYGMLLILGLSLGSNAEVISKITEAGLLALILTLAAVAGSILTAFLLYRLVFKRVRS